MYMLEIETLENQNHSAAIAPTSCLIPAVGFFGCATEKHEFDKTQVAPGYIRNLEQLPNFALPLPSNFVDCFKL